MSLTLARIVLLPGFAAVIKYWQAALLIHLEEERSNDKRYGFLGNSILIFVPTLSALVIINRPLWH